MMYSRRKLSHSQKIHAHTIFFSPVSELPHSDDFLCFAGYRFAFKMMALRGEFSKGPEQDSERDNKLANALFSFPGPCTLKVVARKEGEVISEILSALGETQGELGDLFFFLIYR